jgi:prepilin signal peptidase PulO-like enzyme (type II secretory pathway)
MNMLVIEAWLSPNPGGLWLAMPVWVVLAVTAVIDARTGRVPDRWLMVGAAFGFLCLLEGANVMSAGYGLFTFRTVTQRLLSCVLLGAGLWSINEIYRFIRHHDALGMGDAKWSMLAAMVFGAWPVVFAWFVGAWLALGWLFAKRKLKLRHDRVYFVPFLLLGLLIVKLFV